MAEPMGVLTLGLRKSRCAEGSCTGVCLLAVYKTCIYAHYYLFKTYV